MIEVKVNRQYYDATAKEMKHEGDVYSLSEERYERLKATFEPKYFERTDKKQEKPIVLKAEDIAEIELVDEVPEGEDFEGEVIIEGDIEDKFKPKKKSNKKKARE